VWLKEPPVQTQSKQVKQTPPPKPPSRPARRPEEYEVVEDYATRIKMHERSLDGVRRY